MMLTRTAAPRTLLLVVAIAAIILGGSAEARARKLGKQTVVDARHGFVMRLVEKFEGIPTQPQEKLVIKRFTGPETTSGWSRFSPTLQIVWIPKVDEDEAVATGDDEGFTGEPARTRIRGAREWLEHEYRGAVISREQELKQKIRAKVTPPGKKRAKSTKVDGTLFDWSAPTARGVTSFSGIGLIVPTDRGEFGLFYCHTIEEIDDWRMAFQQSVLSFQLRDRQRVEKVSQDAKLNEFDGKAFRKAHKADLPDGWRAYDTPNYLLIHHVDTKLARKLGGRLEGCRRLYEKMFPPKDDREAVSVVRVCADRDEYHKYGGPPGTAGYWSKWDKELVFYKTAKKDTFAVLHHEAFHQYIYYCYGELAPHSWYNEGHGDYFSGVKFNERHEPVRDKPFDWRKGTVRDLNRRNALVPLEKFIHFTQRQYYTQPHICYPQGWAFVYFLRASDKLRPKWRQILPRYMDALFDEHEVVRKEKEAEAARKKAEEEAAEKAAREIEEAGGEGEAGKSDDDDPPPTRDGESETGDDGEEEGDEDEGGMDARFGQFDENDRILEAAVTAAFEGIDLAELERAFRKFIQNSFKDR